MYSVLLTRFAGSTNLKQDRDEELHNENEGVSATLDIRSRDAGVDIDLNVRTNLHNDVHDGLELDFNLRGNSDVDNIAVLRHGIL